MEISIWFPKDEFVNVSSDTIVYTMRIQDDETPNLLCDSCWTDKAGVMKHFWHKYHKREELEFLEMTFGQYIKKHFKEIRGMNSFWDLGRIKFLNHYNSKWKLSK